jgi:hypothetical protein
VVGRHSHAVVLGPSRYGSASRPLGPYGSAGGGNPIERAGASRRGGRHSTCPQSGGRGRISGITALAGEIRPQPRRVVRSM